MFFHYRFVICVVEVAQACRRLHIELYLRSSTTALPLMHPCDGNLLVFRRLQLKVQVVGTVTAGQTHCPDEKLLYICLALCSLERNLN
mmetsp:Transcript_33485/g.92528  ORF Transcript_33485/g.92528 Transcript_33485/m.92528 type:complete len:88 (+) Transcript_33485:440-703(+)